MVFISWSGETSGKVAAALRDLISVVVQRTQPWMSSEDIAAGADWDRAVSSGLQGATFGIVCLTPDNLNSPWLHYEAGALAERIRESLRVCPVRFNLEASDIKPPLGRFQSKSLEHGDILQLLKSVNDAEPAPTLPVDVLTRALEGAWDRFQQAIGNISVRTQRPPRRPDRELLEEILTEVRAFRNEHLAEALSGAARDRSPAASNNAPVSALEESLYRTLAEVREFREQQQTKAQQKRVRDFVERQAGRIRTFKESEGEPPA